MKLKWMVIPAAFFILYFFLIQGKACADIYPQFDISGFKKWQYYKIQVSPQSNYYLAQTQLGGLSSTLGLSGPLQERLLLKIDSKLSEHLKVSYDILQEPESPQKSDVKVTYDGTELTFGDFTAAFAGNEFVSATKYLNGVMLTSHDPTYNFTFVPATKSKSFNQQFSSGLGNNTRGPYSLGHGSIVEGSEKIILNNIAQVRGVDYTIDYFEGKITFTKILSPADNFTYTYEFTNFLDLFFPTVSNRDFFGIEARKTLNKMFYENDLAAPTIYSTGEAKETFPGTAARSDLSKEAVIKEESKGIYRLKYKPVVEFSENIIFDGNKLKKFEEYYIDYDQGTLFLSTDSMPTSNETISVSYTYYNSTSESENIPGIDSKGSYKLLHSKIVSKSEIVMVDKTPNFKDLDYLIDYDSGKITFSNKIPSVSIISIKYDYVKSFTPPKPESKNAYTFGMTYLKESAKKGAGVATNTVIETKSGKDIVNNLLSLSNFPLDSTQTVTVRVNGSDFTNFYIPTSDALSLKLPYINIAGDASDGYATGTIKFNTSLNATDEVVVIYAYKKSIVGKYTGYGNGSRGPYFLTNITNIVPASDRMQAWNSGSSVIETYARNSSQDALSGRYSINYNYPYTPYIMFNDPFPINKNFTLTFYYIPSGLVVQDRDLNHDVMGVDASFKIADAVKFDGAFGKSRTDKVIIAESTKESFVGNNSRGPYSLFHTNIIEGSEKVYVDGWLRNRDIDYFINYSSGQISFYYISIKPENTVQVEYNYQSISGLPTASQHKDGNAVKVALRTNAGPFSLATSLREIEPEFSPMGSTSMGIGSQIKSLDVNYSPNNNFLISSGLIETKNQIGSYKGYFNWNTDRNLKLSASPANLFKLNLNYRNTKSYDDLVPGALSHSNDSISNALSGSFSPRMFETSIFTFSNSNDFTKTQSNNNLNSQTSYINFLHTSNSFNFFKKASLGIDYQYSEPLTQTSEGKVAHEISKDLSQDLNIDMTFGFLKRFSSRLRSLNHEQVNLITSSKNQTRNESFNINLDPLSNLSTSYEKNRQETLSVQTGVENPHTERNTYSISLFPFSSASMNYSQSDDDSLQESGYRSKGKVRNASLDFTPFRFLKLGSRIDRQNRQSVSINGTNEITTDLNTETRNYTASITPFNLFTINSELIVENYNNKDSTGQVNTVTQNTTSRYGTSLTPAPRLNITANYSLKKTKDLIINIEKPKEIYDASASYNINDWGAFAYTWNQERNLGEVQAGIVANYDILKITNNYSLIITIPQSNPVITNIKFTTSYKEVLYSDYLTPSNNFLASLLSFEGTINF